MTATRPASPRPHPAPPLGYGGMPLPTGTVTFLFTDVAGTATLWEEHPEAIDAALARHDALLEAVVEAHGGAVVRPRGEGDSRFCVFAAAPDAVAAAAAMTRGVHDEPWPPLAPIRVRFGLHTGHAGIRAGDYYGAAVNRCALLRALAHPGQVLLSGATAELVRDALPAGATLRDLGAYRLRDRLRERVFQLVLPGLPGDFPPLTTVRDLLDRQEATAAVLRLIAAGPANLQAVLDAVKAHAVRLCDAADAVVWQTRGNRVVSASSLRGVPPTPELLAAAPPLHPNVPPARAVLERQTVCIPDLAGAAAGRWQRRWLAGMRRDGARAFLAAPLVHEGAAIGAIFIWRTLPAPFSPQEVALLESFADQATIAIENARLLSELQASNRTLTEALEQQTATAEVLRAISSVPTDLQRVLDTIAASAARLCDAADVTVRRLEGGVLRLAAWHGEGSPPPAEVHVDRADNPLRRVVETRQLVHNHDVAAEFPGQQSWIARSGLRSMLHAPLLRDGAVIGSLSIRRTEVRPFTAPQIRLLQTFADQAVIAVENARLFAELEASNRTLNEALEQQTATAEVLKIISRSAFDLNAVLRTLLENAVRLCNAASGIVHQYDGECCRIAVGHGISEPFREFVERNPTRANRASLVGRVILDRRVVHIPDARADSEYRYAGIHVAPYRTLLGVPLLRDGQLLGVFALQRYETLPFTEREMALVSTFADQAAIAIENARLIGELRDRDARRHGELERAAAIQRRFLPASIAGWPGVLEVAHRFRPAVETSGDFYDVLRLTPTVEGALPPLQVAVGDVAGKGMAAALVTALARAALHATAALPTQMATPAGTLRVAGARLHRDVGYAHFVACALAVLEPPGAHHAGPRLRLANAAQVPVLLVRDGHPQEIEPPGYRLPLGAQADGDYKDVEADLRPGDVVVFSSDGLVEAPATAAGVASPHLPPPDRPGELFGFARLARAAAYWASRASDAESVAAGLWSDLTAWAGPAPHHDDMTLVVLRVR